MLQTRIVIRPTRSVRDLYRGRKYRIVARFPGGREIDLGSAETRSRAFDKAREASQPQSSPTAASGGSRYNPNNVAYAPWKRQLGQDDPIIY